MLGERTFKQAGSLVLLSLVAAAHAEPAYDPLAAARATDDRKIANVLAPVPPQCYTRTGRASNPCYVCHTVANGRNQTDDKELQEHYRFGPLGMINHWTNLFGDRRQEIAVIDDARLLAWVRADNFTPLRAALAARRDFRGWTPDIDYALGFDAQGFARDGSGWRAFRYKPFPGTFWPTNGSTDDSAIRLPLPFRTTADGHASLEVYKANLAIVEAAVAVPDTVPTLRLTRAIEPVNETAAGIDLDADGRIGGVVTTLRGLPAHYAGAAAAVPVVRYAYPEQTEFLHTVHYLDPDAPDMRAARIKEVRYAYKKHALDDEMLALRYFEDALEAARGGRDSYGGGSEKGLSNDFGWVLQGWIEDAEGRLRLQTREEHLYCMGCHTGLGVTVDQTFSLPRKPPGAAGWGEQTLAGLRDAPTAGTKAPEYLRYLERVGGGDELRGNEEMLARFFRGGQVDRAAVARATSHDVASLILPSRSRALALDKAYVTIVREQNFTLGRDALLAPAVNVHRQLKSTDTELRAAGHVYRDYRLWLDWRHPKP